MRLLRFVSSHLHRSMGLAITLCGAIALSPSTARAELTLGHKYKRPEVAATPLAFTKDDFVNAVREPMPKDTYFVGEPVFVPMRIINHTQFEINAMTSLNAQSGLEIQIRKLKPEMESPRACKGPYAPGSYTPGPVVLYPFEEFPLKATVWADRETENGLAFPTAGEYVVRLGLKVAPELSTVSGVVQTEAFLIKVVEPTGPDAEIVQALAAKKGFIELQTRKVPEGMEEDMKRWIATAPDAKMTPYLAHTLGMAEYQRGLSDNKTAVAHFNQALEYLKIASRDGAPTRADALDDMLRLYDKTGESFLAKQTALEVLRAMPIEVATRKGSTAEYRKYLYNTGEMDPITYWDLLK